MLPKPSLLYKATIKNCEQSFIPHDNNRPTSTGLNCELHDFHIIFRSCELESSLVIQRRRKLDIRRVGSAAVFGSAATQLANVLQQQGIHTGNRLREMHFESFTCRLCLPGSLPRHRWPSANMQIVSDTRYAGSIHRSPTSWCRSIIISEAYNGSRLDRPYSNGTQRIYRHTLHFNWWTKTISTTIPSQLIRAAHRQNGNNSSVAR